MPILVSKVVTEGENLCPIWLPTYRRSLRWIENRIVNRVAVIVVVAAEIRLTKGIPQGVLAAQVLGVLPQKHEFNWILVSK